MEQKNSCLYRLRVTHERATPKHHRFALDTFMFYLDLDEFTDSTEGGGTGTHGNTLLNPIYKFIDSDFFPFTEGKNIRSRIEAYLRINGHMADGLKLRMLSNLRTCGYLFNPITIYFCFDADDRLQCALAEVTNTFKERKVFFIGERGTATEGDDTNYVRQVVDKNFYISPFASLDARLEFKFGEPSEKISISAITRDSAGNSIVSAYMEGNRLALNRKTLLLSTLKYPLVTAGVISLIYWQALKLYLKRVPFLQKDDNPHLQKDVWNAHKNPARTEIDSVRQIDATLASGRGADSANS